MHKFKESLTAMIGDFANMNRTPDFKAKSETKEAECAEERGGTKKTAGPRRHSLNITVGAEELPQCPKRNRSASVFSGAASAPPANFPKGRRASAPCVSVSGTQLKDKIRKMRSKDDTFTEMKEEEEAAEEEEEDTMSDAEELKMKTKMALQRERRPSSYLL